MSAKTYLILDSVAGGDGLKRPWLTSESGGLLERSVAHARGGADGRQEGCERGYYHLHRQLDDTLLLHTIFRFFFGGVVVRGSASPEAGGARLLCCGILCP